MVRFLLAAGADQVILNYNFKLIKIMLNMLFISLLFVEGT